MTLTNPMLDGDVPHHVGAPWSGRGQVIVAAIGECVIGGVGFLLLGRPLSAFVAFVVRTALVITILVSAMFAFDNHMSPPCMPSTYTPDYSERWKGCERNASYTFYGSLAALGIVVAESAAWIIWRGDERF